MDSMIDPGAAQWRDGFETGLRHAHERIAEQLRTDAELIESFAAPGKAVLLAAHMIASTSPISGSKRSDL